MSHVPSSQILNAVAKKTANRLPSKNRSPDRAVDQVLRRHVEVDVLRPARVLGPRSAERRVEAVDRVEIQAERRQVLAEGQRDEVRVGLRRPYERQQAHNSELVVDHARRDVGHSAVRVRLDTWKEEFSYLDISTIQTIYFQNSFGSNCLLQHYLQITLVSLAVYPLVKSNNLFTARFSIIEICCLFFNRHTCGII